MSENIKYPLLNKDINIHIVKSGIFLRNMKSGKTYHVGKIEYAILSTFDGNHSIDELKEINAKYMKEKQFEEFVFYSNANGLLESSQKQKKTFDVLKIRKALFCPMKILHDGLFIKALRLFLIIGSLLSIGGLVWFIRNRTTLLFQVLFSNNYLQAVNVLYYFISIFIIGFFHEMAHAIMIISYGGNVFEVGIMLNYFHPAFYVDITGVEQIKLKSSRICIWLAGIMSEIIIAFPMMLLAFYEKSPLYFNEFLIIFNILNVSMIIFNLLFVIKLDGYYILSELLDIKGLREKSISGIMNGRTEKENAGTTTLEKLIFDIMGIILIVYLPLFIMQLAVIGVNHFFPKLMPVASQVMFVWIILGCTVFTIRIIVSHIRMRGLRNE